MDQKGHNLIAALAMNQRHIAQLLRDHDDDGSGRCTGCNTVPTSRPRHPCYIRNLATRARTSGPSQS